MTTCIPAGSSCGQSHRRRSSWTCWSDRRGSSTSQRRYCPHRIQDWDMFMHRVKKHPVGKKENLCKWTLPDHLVKLSARFCSFFLKIISWSEPSTTINLISSGSESPSLLLIYFESSNFNWDPPPVEVVDDGLDNDERHHPGSRLPHQVGHILHIPVWWGGADFLAVSF